jgi:hypothetical protein
MLPTVAFAEGASAAERLLADRSQPKCKWISLEQRRRLSVQSPRSRRGTARLEKASCTQRGKTSLGILHYIELLGARWRALSNVLFY